MNVTAVRFSTPQPLRFGEDSARIRAPLWNESKADQKGTAEWAMNQIRQIVLGESPVRAVTSSDRTNRLIAIMTEVLPRVTTREQERLRDFFIAYPSQKNQPVPTDYVRDAFIIFESRLWEAEPSAAAFRRRLTAFIEGFLSSSEAENNVMRRALSEVKDAKGDLDALYAIAVNLLIRD